MATLPFMPIEVESLLADTVGLSTEEMGAQVRLMMIAWRSPNCRLPDDDVKLSRYVGLTRSRWSKVKPKIMGLWRLEEEFWSNEAIDRQHAFVTKRAKTSRENGVFGGRPKVLRSNETDYPAGSFQDTQPATTHTNNHTQTNTAIPHHHVPRASADFDGIWAAFPRHPTSSRARAREAYDELSPADHALLKVSVTRYATRFMKDCVSRKVSSEDASRYVPHLSRWVRSGDWREDAVVEPISPSAALTPEEVEYVDRFAEERLFRECERVRRKQAPELIQRYAFRREVVAEAKANLENTGASSAATPRQSAWQSSVTSADA